MNHPTREELTLHLLGEAPEEVRRRVGDHLNSCPGCAAQAAAWRGALRRLDAWRLRPPARMSVASAAFGLPFVRLAAAAVLVLGVGVALGRVFAPAADLDGVRRAVAAEVSAEVRAEVRQSVQQLARQVDSGRAEDLREIQALLVALDQKRVAEYAELRRDLETVATFTDEEIREARRRLTLLATLSTSAAAVPNE
jgi:hypothetical protein